jgi:ATP adenylyltransferase/5',5'''-P-1,P-4-tetraphosphate phosphorylase II
LHKSIKNIDTNTLNVIKEIIANFVVNKIKKMDLQLQIDQLFEKQKNSWLQLKESIQLLDYVKEKTFVWDDSKVTLQLNPKRVVSTTHDVKKNNVCYLCKENRPDEQEGIVFKDKYIILCNPFPILHNHLTIPLHSHVPQRLGNKIADMLLLAEELPEYIVFYNGPKSGASMVNHFHFQAGLKREELLQSNNDLRFCFSIRNESINETKELFEEVYKYISSISDDEIEPMMNIIAYTENNNYNVNIFPRKLHRPKQYFANDDNQMLISPGALDMAGLLITIREEDFEKMRREDIEDIYSQVSYNIF